MEKLEKDLPFARPPRSDAPAAPAASEGDALLQLLLPLLEGAGAPEPASLEDLQKPDNTRGLGERLGGLDAGLEPQPGAEGHAVGARSGEPLGGLGGGLQLPPSAEIDGMARGGAPGAGLVRGSVDTAVKQGLDEGISGTSAGASPQGPGKALGRSGEGTTGQGPDVSRGSGARAPADGSPVRGAPSPADGTSLLSHPGLPPEGRPKPLPGPLGGDSPSGAGAPPPALPAPGDPDAPMPAGPPGSAIGDSGDGDGGAAAEPRPRGPDSQGGPAPRGAPVERGDPLTPRPGAVIAGKSPVAAPGEPGEAPAARGPGGLALNRGDAAALGLAGEAASAEATAAAATPLGGWGSATEATASGGFGQQVSMGLAGLAADSVDARRQAFAGATRSRSDLENLEPATLGLQQRRTMQSPGAPAMMQPVVAQIAADMYRMQTARLDQLMASRAADEDGEPPPQDAEEALMRQREIKGVDLGGMWRWDLTPSIPGPSLDEAVAVHLPFRAALLTVTLQDPAAVLPMFAREGERDGLRLYVPDPAAPGALRARWEAVQLGPQTPLSWMTAAEQAFMRAYPEGDAREALQALLGRAAVTQAVVGDEGSAKRLWKQLCAASSPRQVPTVLRTLDVEGIPLAAAHAYGVLGTFVRDSAWMVTLCDPLAPPESNVFAVPFAAIRRSADTLTVSARAA